MAQRKVSGGGGVKFVESVGSSYGYDLILVWRDFGGKSRELMSVVL